ncbi:MAG: acetyl-CoA carboxylase, carboxyltransferase subunit beta [Bacteroidota bacterium]|nr:acetyl-CoA carboxylase, carboxyltransferase subunit beta [Bacteroidota bacterium]MEC9065337.1 acetyl-CoA carboxylase, carboxyltransferase subunit beta [Bacteroidota bacterium]|tara:strand:+ start:478 stop:1341 length:864 start_codon:yes stop_codon:yes gene_type:complete
MAWFKRKSKNIQTKTEEKKDIPAGLWYKTPAGKIVETKELSENQYVSPEDDYHVHIGSKEYFEILFDNNKFTEIDSDINPVDFLNFVDQKKYSDRIKEAQNKTGLKDAIRVAYGKSYGKSIVIACMDFKFIGGSMGSVVGEKIVRAINYSIKRKIPLVIISKSGGARMMESATSLMQMAKTAAKLNELSESKIPYISLCTDPTTGGTTASFAMLGDINISEPGALIAFAGPRVVKDTTGKDLPDGFQTSEFLLEKGFLDFISHRKNLKKNINLYIDLIQNKSLRNYI